jgi:hypothetical protein
MKKFLLTIAAVLGFASQAGSKTVITLDQLQANTVVGVMVNTGKGWTQAQLDPSLTLDTTTVPPTLKSNGNSGPTFVDGVTPVGSVDGVNLTFTLPSAPNPAASLELSVNGLTYKSTLDYTLTSATITFIPASVPASGSVLLASYRR